MGSRHRQAKAGAGSREEPPRPALFVGLGASADGLEALQQFFASVPADSGLVFVVVQHLEPRHPSLLVELLGRYASLPVAAAADGVRPECDRVYVIPPVTLLTLLAGTFRVTTAPDPNSQAPIDRFLRSLADEADGRAVGIVFSGAGHDGTAGLRAIKERGGLTLAQSPETARHDSMPESAIAAGVVDHVLPPNEMAAKLLEHAGHPAAER
jgi:two-component system, chemotaxis family, CheB/CheR fusion protein